MVNESELLNFRSQWNLDKTIRYFIGDLKVTCNRFEKYILEYTDLIADFFQLNNTLSISYIISKSCYFNLL